MFPAKFILDPLVAFIIAASAMALPIITDPAHIADMPFLSSDVKPKPSTSLLVGGLSPDSGSSICGSGVAPDRPALFLGLSRLMRSQ